MTGNRFSSSWMEGMRSFTVDSAERSAPALMISGTTCAGCVHSVEQMLSAVQGVAHVEVHLGGGRAVVDGTALAETLVDAIKGGCH
jgi:P-type Cu+ transporter